MLNPSTSAAATRRRFVAVAAVLGWAGLSIQLYLIFYSRWTLEASLIGGLVSFFLGVDAERKSLETITDPLTMIHEEEAQEDAAKRRK